MAIPSSPPRRPKSESAPSFSCLFLIVLQLPYRIRPSTMPAALKENTRLVHPTSHTPQTAEQHPFIFLTLGVRGKLALHWVCGGLVPRARRYLLPVGIACYHPPHRHTRKNSRTPNPHGESSSPITSLPRLLLHHLSFARPGSTVTHGLSTLRRGLHTENVTNPTRCKLFFSRSYHCM